MQIHELNNYNGNLDSGAFIAVDNGSDTGKVSTTQLLSETNDQIDQVENSLGARIDNIIAGGTAPSESEIIDARRGADGINYNSLGDAIRGQFDELTGDITEIDTSLFDKTQNVYPLNTEWANAVITSAGAFVEQSTGAHDATTVDFIPVTGGENWVISWSDDSNLSKNMYITAYDSAKNWISNFANLTMNSVTQYGTFVTPNDCAFIRMHIYRGGNEAWRTIIPSDIQVEKGTTPTEYQPLTQISKLVGMNERINNLGENKRLITTETNLLSTLIPGYLANDGTFNTTTSGWHRSDYIETEPGQWIYFYNVNPFNLFGWFDENKTWIGGKNIETPTVLESQMLVVHQAPANAKYLIVSLEDERIATAWGNYTPTVPTGDEIYANINTLRAYESYPTNPCDYNGLDACTFRKGLCIGDSLTAGGFNHSTGTNPWADGNVYSYPSQFQKMTGTPITNEGHSGLSSVQWWNTYGTGGSDPIDFSGYDFAIVSLGVNDVSQGISTADSKTALENIIGALQNANTGIKIFICTIIPSYANPATSNYDDINNMIRSLDSISNVYICDLTQYGHEYNTSQYSAGHLTAYGYWRLAKDLIAYIGYLMNEYPSEFRFIQFIGTDMTY